MIKQEINRNISTLFREFATQIMSEDMEKIFEISLSKIEHSKSRKVCGKSTMLHRTLLVNSVINRVRNSDRMLVKHEQDKGTPFMNYREPKVIVDVDDYDTEKVLTLTECQTRTNQVNTNNEKRILSSLVTKLNSRSLHGKVGESFTKHIYRIEELEGKENSHNVECNKTTTDLRRSPNSQKRLRSSNYTDVEEQSCPKKKLRCLWPTNIGPYGQDLNFSIAGLASLFGDLVASTDAENSSITLNGNFATAMVAC